MPENCPCQCTSVSEVASSFLHLLNTSGTGDATQVVKETRKLFGKLPSSTRAPLEPIQAAPSPSSADSSTEEGTWPLPRLLWLPSVLPIWPMAVKSLVNA